MADVLLNRYSECDVLMALVLRPSGVRSLARVSHRQGSKNSPQLDCLFEERPDIVRPMAYHIKRKAKKDPEGRLVMLFEVVDAIDGQEHHPAERPHFETK